MFAYKTWVFEEQEHFSHHGYMLVWGLQVATFALGGAAVRLHSQRINGVKINVHRG
jgi:hypothetical protein